MKYYVNGEAVPEKQAHTLFIMMGENGGSDRAELEAIWGGRIDFEDCRDIIFEVSGYILEIDVGI